MAGFGENLRREREMRGISLEEISETTKISVRFLNALENEEFAKLPGGIFIRSFIRAYATYLGLDADSELAEFHLIAPSAEDEDLSKLCVSGARPKRSKLSSVLPGILALILLGGGYAIFRYAHRSSDTPVTYGNPETDVRVASPGSGPAAGDSASSPQVLPRQSTTPTALPALPQGKAAGASASAHSPISSSRTNTGAPAQATDPGPAARSGSDSQSSSSIAAAEKGGELVLQVAARQPSWVAVDADGKTVFERVLTPDNTHTLIAKNYFDVTTGNALETVLTLNGIPLKSLGRRGEVRKLHLTRDDLKKITP